VLGVFGGLGVATLKVRQIIVMGLMIGLNVLLSRFLALHLGILRISMGCVAIYITAIMYGPVAGGCVGAIADIVGIMLFPTGIYFPGFTISGFLTGYIYGAFCYHNSKKINIILAIIVQLIVVSLVLNTTWVMILTFKGVWAIFPIRLANAFVKFAISLYIFEKITKFLKKRNCISGNL